MHLPNIISPLLAILLIINFANASAFPITSTSVFDLTSPTNSITEHHIDNEFWDPQQKSNDFTFASRPEGDEFNQESDLGKAARDVTTTQESQDPVIILAERASDFHIQLCCN